MTESATINDIGADRAVLAGQGHPTRRDTSSEEMIVVELKAEDARVQVPAPGTVETLGNGDLLVANEHGEQELWINHKMRSPPICTTTTICPNPDAEFPVILKRPARISIPRGTSPTPGPEPQGPHLKREMTGIPVVQSPVDTTKAELSEGEEQHTDPVDINEAIIEGAFNRVMRLYASLNEIARCEFEDAMGAFCRLRDLNEIRRPLYMRRCLDGLMASWAGAKQHLQTYEGLNSEM